MGLKVLILGQKISETCYPMGKKVSETICPTLKLFVPLYNSCENATPGSNKSRCTYKLLPPLHNSFARDNAYIISGFT